LRIISQPVHGTVGVTNTTGTNWFATYYPEPGFVGTETFTFSAWNGASDSNLGTGTVAVAQGAFSITATAQVPPSFLVGLPAPFGVVAKLSNISSNITYDWNFGDLTAHATNKNAVHVYASPGTYSWKVISTVQGPTSKSATNSGSILISGGAILTAQPAGSFVDISWPASFGSAQLEQSPVVNPGAIWTGVTNSVIQVGGNLHVTVPSAGKLMFYRLRL
jgi:PKD repeat protein